MTVTVGFITLHTHVLKEGAKVMEHKAHAIKLITLSLVSSILTLVLIAMLEMERGIGLL